jgi:hypothetical protein
LLVLRMVKIGRHFRAECLCDCGQIRTVNMHQLCIGRTQSCGCFKKEWLLSLRKPPEYKREMARILRHRRLRNYCDKYVAPMPDTERVTTNSRCHWV